MSDTKNKFLKFSSRPSVKGFYSVVGSKEAQGTLGKHFNKVVPNALIGEKSWEQAETRIQQLAIDGALGASGVLRDEIDCIFGGDLLNQCVATAYAVRESDLPFIGLYGACSTAAEGHLLAAAAIDAGFAQNTLSIASSHFCGSEKQFRFPLEYGGQRTPTAQWTATGAGAFLFSRHCDPPYVEAAMPGRIRDYGVTDMANMGAAMAPAAADTILRFFHLSGISPEGCDLIVTGDLGKIGSSLLLKLLSAEGLDLRGRHADCGSLLYGEDQDTHAGGSGAGCSAAVMAAYFLPKLAKKELRRLLFVGTGALMSPLSVKQGESIPAIAHLVCFTSNEEQSFCEIQKG